MAMAQTARTATGRRPTHDYHTPAISLRQSRSKSANPGQLRPLSGIHGAAVSSRPRYVPPFSIQSQQKNTVVIDGPILESAPKTASARARVPNPKSAFVCLFLGLRLLFVFLITSYPHLHVLICSSEAAAEVHVHL